jgi:hypothetical protein
MSTNPIFGPKARFFDSNGDPLAGGKLYSYAAGTSTPLATYTTEAGSVANANPVILNANGEADVWTTQGVNYKFELRNSANVVQWTVDNVPSIAGSVNTFPFGATITGVTCIGPSSSGTAGTFTGGAPNGHAIVATGDGTGSGVRATGGDNSGIALHGIGGAPAGTGVLGLGGGSSGVGVLGVGGATTGTGVSGQSGASGGYGVDGIANGTSGAGVRGITDGTNTSGVEASALGSSFAGLFANGQSNAYGAVIQGQATSPVRAALRLIPQNSAPSSPQKGDLYVNNTDGKLYIYNGSAWVTVGSQT